MFSREPQLIIEPGMSIPDSLTKPDSILVLKGTPVTISTSAESPNTQVLYTMDISAEKTAIINTAESIPYQTISSKKSSTIQKKLARDINVIGVYYINNNWVDIVCIMNKNGVYFNNTSLRYTQFLQDNLFTPERKVYLNQNTTYLIQNTKIPKAPSRSNCQFPIDTTTLSSDSIPYIASLKKINTKNGKTPNYNELITHLKQHEDPSQSESHLTFHLVGIMDLDNDQVNELIIEARGYESSSYSIYSYHEKWELVYSGGGCGI